MSHRGLPKTKEIKIRLRKEAELRQEEYSSLSFQQKFDRLPPAPAGAKVRAKLEQQAQKQTSDAKKNK